MTMARQLPPLFCLLVDDIATSFITLQSHTPMLYSGVWWITTLIKEVSVGTSKIVGSSEAVALSTLSPHVHTFSYAADCDQRWDPCWFETNRQEADTIAQSEARRHRQQAISCKLRSSCSWSSANTSLTVSSRLSLEHIKPFRLYWIILPIDWWKLENDAEATVSEIMGKSLQDLFGPFNFTRSSSSTNGTKVATP